MEGKTFDEENRDRQIPQPDRDESPRDYWAEQLGASLQEKPSLKEKKGSRKQEEIPGEYLDILEPERKRPPRWLWILLAGLLVLGLLLGGFLLLHVMRDPSEDQMYYGKVCTLGEKEYTAVGDWVKLRSRGRAELCLLDRQRRGDWEVRDNRLIIRCGEDLYEGKLREGVMVLDQGDCHFVLAQAGIPWNEEKTQAVLAPPKSPALWSGDYYGWWQVTEGWGGWESYAGQRYDACGRIWVENDNTGYFELWDDQCGFGQLVAAADLQVTEGVTDQGCLTFGSGQFLDLPLAAGSWSFDPGREPYTGLSQVLILKGTLADGPDGFSYLVVLRPWGVDWKDMDSFVCPDLPVSDRLPDGYKDWYLPMLGRKEPMPEMMGDGTEQ